jgi:hypothetical protein
MPLFPVVRRQPVASSQIASIGWHANSVLPDVGDDDLGLLEVEFVRERMIYRYGSVPRRVYRQLMDEQALVAGGEEGASVGGLFNRLVKKGNYAYAKIGPAEDAPDTFTLADLRSRLDGARRVGARHGQGALASVGVTLAASEVDRLVAAAQDLIDAANQLAESVIAARRRGFDGDLTTLVQAVRADADHLAGVS